MVGKRIAVGIDAHVSLRIAGCRFFEAGQNDGRSYKHNPHEWRSPGHTRPAVPRRGGLPPADCIGGGCAKTDGLAVERYHASNHDVAVKPIVFDAPRAIMPSTAA